MLECESLIVVSSVEEEASLRADSLFKYPNILCRERTHGSSAFTTLRKCSVRKWWSNLAAEAGTCVSEQLTDISDVLSGLVRVLYMYQMSNSW